MQTDRLQPGTGAEYNAVAAQYACGCRVLGIPVYDNPRKPAWILCDCRIQWCALHATADDTLAALRNMLGSYHVPDAGLEGDELAMYEAAEDAIAKAEGGAR